MQFLPTSKEYNKPTEDPIIGRDGEGFRKQIGIVRTGQDENISI